MRPKKLDKLAFWYTEPLKNVQRYAHWADVATEHTVIFLGFILSLLVFVSNHTVSALVVSTVLVCGFWGWRDFGWKVDENIAVGSDDRTSVWMILTGFDLEKAVLEFREGELYVTGMITADHNNDE